MGGTGSKPRVAKPVGSQVNVVAKKKVRGAAFDSFGYIRTNSFPFPPVLCGGRSRSVVGTLYQLGTHTATASVADVHLAGVDNRPGPAEIHSVTHCIRGRGWIYILEVL